MSLDQASHLEQQTPKAIAPFISPITPASPNNHPLSAPVGAVSETPSEYELFTIAGRLQVELPMSDSTTSPPANLNSNIPHLDGATNENPVSDIQKRLRDVKVSTSKSKQNSKKEHPDEKQSRKGSGKASSHKRPNQAERRRQTRNFQLESSHAQTQSAKGSIEKPEIPQAQGAKPVRQAYTSPNNSDTFETRSRNAPKGDQKLLIPYEKKFPPSHQLGPNVYQVPQISVEARIDYVNHLAFHEVNNVEISPMEYSEKLELRQHLEAICRQVVSNHERQNFPDFDPATVELKAFGSLDTGFATKGSDMDVVLVSPLSSPSLSSPESVIPRIVELALLNLGYGTRLLTKTRVPIIKFCQNPGPQLAGCLRQTRLIWEEEIDNHQDSEGTAEQKMRHNQDRYSNFELAGQLKRIINSKTQTPETLKVIADFNYTLVNKTQPHQICDVQDARRALQAQPKLLSACPTPSREDLDYPKSGVGIHCDINFSNELALHNSLLLKCYSICDPRVRIMVLFVKAWSKTRQINSPYHGTMSSYGYVLMVLHYLMNVALPPVLPNLQLLTTHIAEDHLSATTKTFNGFNIQFFRNESKLRQWASLGQITENRESVGQLLCGFFHYYGQPPRNGFRWKDDVLSLRTRGGIVTKASKGWVGAKSEVVELIGPVPSTKKINHHYVVAIEDPFEWEHNVARTVFFNGIVAIRNEFRRAYSLISCGGINPQGVPEGFFAEGAKNENLQRRTPGANQNSNGRKPQHAQPNKTIDTHSGTTSQGISKESFAVGAKYDNIQKQTSQANHNNSGREPQNAQSNTTSEIQFVKGLTLRTV